jgi:hypothetical protein
VDRLDQLFARSKREIEAHTDELGDTSTGRYFIDEAAQLLSALRLWAQNRYRSDQVVRDILEAGDVVALREVAHKLRQTQARRFPDTSRRSARRPLRLPFRWAGPARSVESWACR